MSKITNKLIQGIVKNWCKHNLTMYKDKYTLEILDFTGFNLYVDECEEIQKHIEAGTAVDYIREWFVDARGQEVGKKALELVAKQIHEYMNVNVLKLNKYHNDPQVRSAIMFWLSSEVELAMPEQAIIDSVNEYMENINNG